MRSHGERGNLRVGIFLVVTLGLTALLVGYTLTHRRPPIPADADHLKSLEPAQCLSCHGPAGKKPRGPNHPLNDQCFSCHERA